MVAVLLDMFCCCCKKTFDRQNETLLHKVVSYMYDLKKT